mmetsp:Transcript_30340/g.47515  ORF Transcript_30340/g.47515 Transcript_30340/m.47515 type:complete len:114 (+) Transcript_30340:629-970(+)
MRPPELRNLSAQTYASRQDATQRHQLTILHSQMPSEVDSESTYAKSSGLGLRFRSKTLRSLNSCRLRSTLAAISLIPSLRAPGPQYSGSLKHTLRSEAWDSALHQQSEGPFSS